MSRSRSLSPACLVGVLIVCACWRLLHLEGLDGSSALHHHHHHHSNQARAGNTSIKPYWHRPGCHQVGEYPLRKSRRKAIAGEGIERLTRAQHNLVNQIAAPSSGHTRTISIPGCVKFNISTNACRGFCMSFSIPATDDIGPPEVLPEHFLEDTQQTSGQQLLMQLGDYSDQDAQQQRHLMDLIMAANNNNNNNKPRKEIESGQTGPANKLNTFLHLSGQTRSPLAGTVGNTSDKRDVVSVSQCCNMMETEDVSGRQATLVCLITVPARSRAPISPRAAVIETHQRKNGRLTQGSSQLQPLIHKPPPPGHCESQVLQ